MIDVYFENVGSEHLEAELYSVRNLARLANCSMSRLCNDTSPCGGDLPCAGSQ